MTTCAIRKPSDRQHISRPITLLNLQYFYRATRMHSADYAVARCLSVRLSVCLSVRHTPVLCVNGYTYPQSFFSPSGSSTILVFPYQTGWQYSDGDPPRPSSHRTRDHRWPCVQFNCSSCVEQFANGSAVF